MRRALKQKMLRAADAVGVLSLLPRFQKGPVILFYHGVEERIADPQTQHLHTPLSTFEKQITYLRRHFQIISLHDLCSGLSTNRALNASQVVLTFDDGYKNNLHVVAPYLHAFGVAFSVFVSTRHISEGLRFPTYYLRTALQYTARKSVQILDKNFDIGTESGKAAARSAIESKMKNSPHEVTAAIVASLIELLPADQWAELNERFQSDQPMDWGDVKALHASGVEIGSHCHDHFLLHRGQDIEEIKRQVRLSWTLIREHLGECRYIAYPNGKTNDVCHAALEAVKSTQYVAGLTTISGAVQADTNPYLLPRIPAATNHFADFTFAVNARLRDFRA